jgi:hypothetical protein
LTRKITAAKAATLAQTHQCRVTVHPDGSFTVEPVDLAAAQAFDSVQQWRMKRDEEKNRGRRP